MLATLMLLKKKNGTSITIYKYQGPATETRSDGSDQTATVNGKSPVEGVEFTLYKVSLTSGTSDDDKKIDLSTPEGWKRIEEIQKLDPKTKKAASFFEGTSPKFTKTKVDAKSTGSDGKAEFTGLAESLYYVEETSTKDAKINSKAVTVTGKVDPFFVTTPLPHKTATSWDWLYNVKVYPKNDTSNDVTTKKAATPTKLYVDKDGSTVIPWDISIPLMPPSDNQTYKKIGFIDSLPEGLTYKDLTNVKLVKKAKTPAGAQANDVNLDETTDYTVTSTEKSGSNPAKVKFELSSSRLTSLSADFGTNTYVLKVTLNTKVTKGTKNFINAINAWIDNNKIGDGDEDHPCVPTDTNPCDKNPHGSSHFATLKITKVNDAEEGKGKKVLKGAKFTVYPVVAGTALTDVADGKSKAEIEAKLDKGNNDANAIKLDETDGNGVTSADLFIGNGDDAKSKIYCVVETEAPAGFRKDETPHCYSVEAETKTNVTNGVVAVNAHEIKNSTATEIDKILAALPMTGARGLVLLTAFGIVGLGGTLFYIITRRRKEQEEA